MYDAAHSLWHWLLWSLAIAAHDPGAIEAERARAAGCVSVAYAAMAQEPAPAPAPAKAPPPAKPVCKECNGTGRIYRPDGGYVRCKCGACSTGTCPKALP